jgi:putative hydrolase of the HAD superfamily
MTAPPSIAAILFDLGGTCLELDHPRIARAVTGHGGEVADGWVAAGERAGRADMEARLASGAPPEQQWRAFFDGMVRAAGAPQGALDAIFDELVAFHREHHLWGRVLPGMPAAVRTLAHRGYRVAAVSNSDGRAEWLLARLGLLDAFEFVIDSRILGVEKPDPRIFLEACRRLGLAPAECAYVGDVLGIDVDGARAAGLWPVLFDAYGSYEPDGPTGAVVPAGTARATGPGDLLAFFPARTRAEGASA